MIPITIEQLVEIAESKGANTVYMIRGRRIVFWDDGLLAFSAELQRRTLREAADLLDITPRGDFPEDQLRRMADEIEG